MNRPRPLMMQNVYRNPRPNNGQWRPHWPQNPAFQRRPNTNYIRPRMSVENSQEHWCETCDRGFPTADLLDKHKQQHQRCNIDGCQFVAHPKIITMHIQMQHSSGLYKKIANLNNPEEIQKWREERKKRFPTKANIERKAAECEEKIKRGEKMALKHDHRTDMKHKSSDPRLGVKRKHNFDKKNNNYKANQNNVKKDSHVTSNNNKPPAKKMPKLLPSIPITTEKNKLKPFTGILNIAMEDNVDSDETLHDSNELFEDDDENLVELPKITQNDKKPNMCGALKSLMCDYGSSDEDVEERQESNSKINEVSNTSDCSTVGLQISGSNIEECTPAIKKTETNYKESYESDDDGPEEVKIVKPIERENNTVEATDIKAKEKHKVVLKKNTPRNERQHYQLKRKVPSTLLQKLLYNEIRHERNIVLQCIRYIRKNNYFDEQ